MVTIVLWFVDFGSIEVYNDRELDERYDEYYLHFLDADGELRIVAKLPFINDNVVKRLKRVLADYIDVVFASDSRRFVNGARMVLRRFRRLARDLGFGCVVRLFDVNDLWSEVEVVLRPRS